MKKKYLILLGVILLIVIVGLSCSFHEPVEESPNTNLETEHDIDTGNTSIDFVEEEKWPSDIPRDVPEFKYGKLSTVMEANTNAKGWMMVIEDLEEGAVNKYVNDLENNGWSVDADMLAMGGIFAEKDNLGLTFEVGLAEEGEGHLSVGYME